MSTEGPLRRALASLAVLVLLGAGGPAGAQAGNPVYVDSSPGAWELLQLAREQALTNEGEAVRLYQELLDEHGGKLIPRHAAARDEFVSVRAQVIADLSGADASAVALLERYRLMQTGEAQRLLEVGALGRLARTRSLTGPGLHALLQSAQMQLEAGRFRSALSPLEEAISHPDLDPDRAAHCFFMLGLASHYLSRESSLARARAGLEALGPDAAATRAALDRLLETGRGPAIARGLTPLDRTESTDLTELVGQTIWSLELPNSLLQRRFPPESLGDQPSHTSGYERKRRQGDLTTVAATVVGPTVYVNEGHMVRALDRFTGRTVWAQPYRDSARSAVTDRENYQAGDLSVIAVEGDSLVTLTGHAHATARSSEGKIVCLETATGRRRWQVSLDRIGGNKEYDDLFPHGAPIIAEGRVYVLARKVSPQMLTGCYVVALDLETGAVEWLRHVASSGSKTKAARPFSTLVHDDGSLYVSTSVGAIAAIDAASGSIRWLRRYSVPVHVRGQSRQPWEMTGPVLVGPNLVSVTPDEMRVVVLDRMTGDELASYDARARDGWSRPAYLIASSDKIFAIGSDIRAFSNDMLEHPLWRIPAPPQSRAEPSLDELVDGRSLISDTMTLVGRVQPVTDALVVPTLSGLLLVDQETGRILHRLNIDASGNPLAVGAQLVLAGADTLQAYMSLSRAEQMLRERIASFPEDPDPALSLLQLGVRVDDLELSLEGATLALAAIDRGVARPESREWRSELFSMLLEIHRRGLAATEAESEQLYAIIGTVAGTAEQRVAHLLAYGDGLAARSPEQAVEVYQTILSQPDLGATLRAEAGIVRPASRWAAARLGRLIDAHGAAVYAPQADYASRVFEHLRDRGTSEEAALASLAEEFPYASASVDAALLVARSRLDRGDERRALASLSAAYHIAPQPERTARLVGGFVEACVDRDRPDLARAILRGVAARADAAPLETTRGPRAAAEWLAAMTSRVDDRSRPRIGVPSEADEPPPFERIDGRLLYPIDDRGRRPDAALVLDGVTLERLGPGFAEGWTTEIDAPGGQLLRHDPEEILLWIGDGSDDPRVVALDAATGRERWATGRLSDHLSGGLAPARAVQSQMPDGMPFVPGETIPLADESTVFLLQRAGGAVAFDRTGGGAFLWSAERTLDEVHAAIAHPFGLAITGLERAPGGEAMRPMVLVLDPRSGKVVHRIAIQSRSGVIWMTADALGSLLCATDEGLELIDLLQGTPRWTNIAFDAMEARQGWLAGDRVIIESRTSRLFTVRIEDGLISAPFDTDVRGDWEKDALNQVYVDGDRVIARYRERIVRYDREGRVLGADIVSDQRDYRWLLSAQDHLVVVSLFDTSQVQPVGKNARPRTQRTYRVYFMSPNCKLEGTMLQPKAMTKRVRGTALIDGGLLMSTDAETLLLRLPPEGR